MTALSRSRAAAAALVVLLCPSAGSAAEPSLGPRPPEVRRLVLTGTWVQPGCVPTAVRPDVEGGSAQVRCTGVAAYSGQLTGYAEQQITARATASSTTARIVADIHGRTSGGLCGSLHLEPEHAVVADGGASGTGPITSGTRDFAGATGWYDATGTGAGGIAQGGYRITLRLPSRASLVPPTTPCLPPAPGALPRRP